MPRGAGSETVRFKVTGRFFRETVLAHPDSHRPSICPRMAGWKGGITGRLAAVLAMAAVLTLVSGVAVSGEALTWAVLDFPPFQILDVPHRGTGSFDGLLEQLVGQMPEYDHHIVPMSFARRDEELRKKTRFCTPGVFRTPARIEQGWRFSLPSLIHLDNRVITLAETASRLGPPGRIDIEALFGRSDLIGGIVAKRSFAPNIDAAIERHRGRANLMIRAMRAEQFFQMLLAGQLDYLILFPHEAAYLAERFGATGRIADRQISGTPPFIFTYVACVGEGWAERMVARINRAIVEIRPTADYRALSERWYNSDDKALIRRFVPDLLHED